MTEPLPSQARLLGRVSGGARVPRAVEPLTPTGMTIARQIVRSVIEDHTQPFDVVAAQVVLMLQAGGFMPPPEGGYTLQDRLDIGLARARAKRATDKANGSTT